MAQRSKGSRPLTVDGTAYHWRLRGRPTYDQGMAWSPMTYAVTAAYPAGPTTTLVVTTPHPHTANWVGRASAPVRPADVAAAVRTALARGWTPTAPGSPFLLDLSAGFTKGWQGSE